MKSKKLRIYIGFLSLLIVAGVYSVKEVNNIKDGKSATLNTSSYLGLKHPIYR